MHKININDLERWKKDSINTVRKVDKLLNKDILYTLENKINLEINTEKRPKDIWYGHAFYNDEPKNSVVEVYDSNPSRFLPRYLSEIFNQSGMDHELIGHIGYYLSGEEHGEKEACVVQKIMAEKREKNSLGWKAASKLIPKVQEYHKDVETISYIK